MKAILITAVLCASAITAPGQDVEVKNLKAHEYQKRFNELTQRGYRPIKLWSKTLGVFDSQDGERPQFGYWATFRKVPNGPPRTAWHGLSAAAYQQEFDLRTKQGYIPSDINVACVGNEVRYCVIYEKVPNPRSWIGRQITKP